MGYRSDVAYVIKFDDIETRDNFVTLMLAKNDKHITEAINECEYGYTKDPIITFEATDVKWYDSFDDVKAHHALMHDAIEIYKEKGGKYRFISIGEDGAEECDEDDDDGDLWDYVTTRHEIHTSFPNVPSGASTLTTETQE